MIQFLEAGQARLEVFAPKNTVIPSELGEKDVEIKHIALKVDDFWKTYEEAKSKGVVFNAEPRRATLGPIVTLLKDPNRILLQLIRR